MTTHHPYGCVLRARTAARLALKAESVEQASPYVRAGELDKRAAEQRDLLLVEVCEYLLVEGAQYSTVVTSAHRMAGDLLSDAYRYERGRA
ncbi:hypothetical protein [Acrocarpospora sp. B8E8]|uniref:hypothetical protein n=1 Tax=Acrocarpospora sp. B8E8 TaxID=3153572 RepID=UPI00325E63EE